jgi:preprotein translocase subunit SecF
MAWCLRLIPATPKLRFVRYKMPALICSLLCILGSFGLLATKGLNLGIDFRGGLVMEIRVSETAAPLSTLRGLLADPQFGEVSLQDVGLPENGQHTVMIRLQAEEGKQDVVITRVKNLFTQTLATPVEYRKIDYVGPQVGSELLRGGILSLALACTGILLYIWFRFEWQFGVGGILALFHDSVLTMGFFSLTGLEFNLTSVAALLTIIGYSINDSVVIYDRIRENLRRYKKLPLSELLDLSINETLSRTILTGGSTLLALVALAMFGGPVLYSFSLSMLFGVLVGTYSSIYISATVLDFMRFRAVEE